MNRDDSPSAFPLGANEYGGHGSAEGMTLRDYFAAKAMQAFISHHGCMFGEEQQFAERSYRLAVAMLDERDK